MKKIAAISLLALFVFNTIGYKLLFSFLQEKEDIAFTAKLDNGQYSDDELVPVKIAMNMPYQTTRTSSERVDGEVTVDGKIYKYVKRTVVNDTMVLMCIPHHEKTILQQKANEYAGKVNDLPGTEKGQKNENSKLQISDFDFIEPITFRGNENVQAVSNLYKNTILPTQFLPVNGQPPERTA